MQLEAFRRDQVLELRLRNPPLTEAVPIASFFDQVAGPTPTPGGGTAAAFVGALAACLPTMVANLTLGRKKYAGSEGAMAQVKRDAARLRVELLALGRRDSEAFEQVLVARRMPQTSADEIGARERAIAAAELEARACHCRRPGPASRWWNWRRSRRGRAIRTRPRTPGSVGCWPRRQAGGPSSMSRST